LNQFTHPSFKTNESQYQIFFETALSLANQKFNSQETTAHGFMDINFVSPKGQRFIVELKVYREDEPESSDALRTTPAPKPSSAQKPSKAQKSAKAPKKVAKPKPLHPPINNADKAKLRESMTDLADKALRQIQKQYADKYRGEGKPVIMVALVMARRTFVLAKFETLES
ncbi:MAG: PD-(D/E)XK nuclease domain-containing protein, partial [Deltaproteobacteria bacterium]|nr:PD-(D/E)XK nuclease domain-containing protein [Deltaproteobacteria bacterium]